MATSSHKGTAPRQLKIPLEHAASCEREDFLISTTNTDAVAMVDTWPDWASNCLVLVGPQGVGKSHLAGAWVRETGGVIISADTLREAHVPEIAAHKTVLLENADRGLKSETALFHLINLVREQKNAILLTGRTLPVTWKITLPDLSSRLRAMPVEEIGEPDEALFKAVLAKLFADRQLKVNGAVIDYIVLRMPRSMQAAIRLVSELDDTALASGRAITKDIARQCLETAEQPE